jgi:hypothetical protein
VVKVIIRCERGRTVLGSDLGKESDTVSDKGLGKRPSKNSGKGGG